MFDFRIKVFYTVAQRLNFTRASEELFISQPAVTRHIKELEQQLNCKLFEREGNKIRLTVAGKVFLDYAQKIFLLYQELSIALDQLNNQHQGCFRLGISTTAAQYVFPKYLANFKSSFPRISTEVHTGNTEHIERFLEDKIIDIGVVEGKSKRSGFVYTPFMKDEIVLCTRVETDIQPVISVNRLKKLSFVFREPGSGSLEIIAAALRKKNIRINELSTEIVLENNESIKNYLQHANAFAFISVFAIHEELKSNRLKIIDIENLVMERYYYFVVTQGESSKISKLFMKFAFGNNLRL